MDLEFDDEHRIVFSREPILYLKIPLLLTSIAGIESQKAVHRDSSREQDGRGTKCVIRVSLVITASNAIFAEDNM